MVNEEQLETTATILHALTPTYDVRDNIHVPPARRTANYLSGLKERQVFAPYRRIHRTQLAFLFASFARYTSNLG
jgi:hypothetical protein